MARQREDKGGRQSIHSTGEAPLLPMPSPPSRPSSARPASARPTAASGRTRVGSKETSPTLHARPACSAATSHLDNDAYMAQMDDAFEAMGLGRPSSDPVSAAPPPVRPAATAAASVRAPARTRVPLADRAMARPAGARASTADTGVGAMTEGAWSYRHPEPTGAGWTHGPADPSGSKLDLSDRNLLCMSAHGDTAVVGCADHALYEIKVSTGRKLRTLYSKRCGHSEWVTSVAHLPDGRVVSGGMDNKACVWAARGVTCVDLVGHGASVSAVLAGGAGGRQVLTASYDKTVRCWEAGVSCAHEVYLLKGHRAPVLCLHWAADGSVASGDRGGDVLQWDVATASASVHHKGAHKGHVTAMTGLEGETAVGGGAPLLLTGGQDGVLRVWDARQANCVKEQPLHVGSRGAGALVAIQACAAAGAVVTAGADARLQVVDPRASWAPRCTHTEHSDFIYTLRVAGRLCFSGAGNGMLHCHDMCTDSLLYGLGVNKHAVQCIDVTERHLVTAGDDGNMLVFDMQQSVAV